MKVVRAPNNTLDVIVIQHKLQLLNTQNFSDKLVIYRFKINPWPIENTRRRYFMKFVVYFYSF